MLRVMTMADLPMVARIEAALQFHPWSEKQFAESLALAHPAWVVLHEAEIAGFAVMMQVLDEATLLEVGVDASAQRRGLGRRLLDAAIEHAQETGMAVMHLEVRVGNKAARQLYRTLGFKEVGRRRGYYRAPVTEATPDGREDAIVMTLVLDEGAR